MCVRVCIYIYIYNIGPVRVLSGTVRVQSGSGPVWSLTPTDQLDETNSPEKLVDVFEWRVHSSATANYVKHCAFVVCAWGLLPVSCLQTNPRNMDYNGKHNLM